MRTRRTFLALAGVTACLALAAPPVWAERSEGRRGHHRVAFTSEAVVVGGDHACDPQDPARCGATFRQVRTESGSFEGTSYVVGSAAPLADGRFQGQSVVQFRGTVKGCGTGTALLLEDGIVDVQTGEGEGSWEVIAEQGTGDLADLTGAGTVGAGGAKGRVRCR